MATAPTELTIAEIRNYMIKNDSKVTNHALVKHFKHFLTKPETQNEARKLFKVYVNILATIKNENNQKYLILRKKYANELPPEDVVQHAVAAAGAEAMPSSPGGISIISESGISSPMRQPPPYIPPPEVPTTPNKDCKCLDQIAQVATIETSKTALAAFAEPPKLDVPEKKQPPEEQQASEVEKRLKAISKEDQQANKENIPRFSFSSADSGTSVGGGSKTSKETIDAAVPDPPGSNVSVKEATRKFNRLVSEEEAKAIVVSPSGKKKTDEEDEKKKEEKPVPEVTLAHKKAKEWIVAMAKANYQDLSKLANEYPELVKLHDPYTTALHWAAKHGNQDVVKLIAGTHKADVNARSNGGYTPLHISMQFGRADVFELLCNVYKANRDLVDYSGNKPLDYSKERPSVSASTFSKIKAKKKAAGEKDSGFLRIGSLNVRVKKTTEAFSNFLGVGNGHTLSHGATANRHHQRSHRHHLQGHRHHPQSGTTVRNPMMMKTKPSGFETIHHHKGNSSSNSSSNSKKQTIGSRASVPVNMNNLTRQFEKLHKSWGSADNIQQQQQQDDDHNAADKAIMPPPKNIDTLVKKRQKSVTTPTTTTRSSVASSIATDSPRGSISSTNSSTNFIAGYSSMPTTPNQKRAPIIGRVQSDILMDSDSDSACGFDSSWSMSGRTSMSSGNLQASQSQS